MSHHTSQAIPLRTTSGLLANPVATNAYIEITGMAGVETGGAAVVAIVLRQASSTGLVLCSMSLGVSGTDTRTFNHPVKCRTQIYVQIIGTGVVDGTVHIL